VLFIDPFSLLDVLFPSESHSLEGSDLIVGSFREEMSVNHRVQEPVEILASDIRNEPSETLQQRSAVSDVARGRETVETHLSVETNLTAESRLDQPIGVNAIAVKFETSVIENEIHTTSLLSSELLGSDVFPNFVEIVSENVLLSSGEMVTSGRLKTFDIFFAHLRVKVKGGGGGGDELKFWKQKNPSRKESSR